MSWTRYTPSHYRKQIRMATTWDYYKKEIHETKDSLTPTELLSLIKVIRNHPSLSKDEVLGLLYYIDPALVK